MLQSDNILHISGVVFAVLISVTVVSYTSKSIFGYDKIKETKPSNYIYDPDHGLNVTTICLLSKDIYKTRYEDSQCFNKTLLYWYNPWLRHILWRELRNEIETKQRIREMKMTEKSQPKVVEVEVPNVTVTEAPVPAKEEPDKMKEQPSELVYAILVGLLILSAVAACWEVFKDKLKRNEGGAAKAQDKQCSLADFTINRHLRRESAQQAGGGPHLTRQASFELPAKVTQPLIHQSSLDRAFPKMSSEVTAEESRRNSVPSFLISNIQHDKVVGRGLSRIPSNSSLWSTKRQSVDVPSEDTGMDMRKKPRHFIRRH